MATTRRDFLINMGLAGGASLLGAWPAFAAPSVAPVLKKLGKVYLLGQQGEVFPGNESNKNTSVISTLDLDSGKIKQTVLDLSLGHSAVALSDERLLCVGQHGRGTVILDNNHKIIKRLSSMDGYLYAGHVLVLPQRGIFLLPTRKLVAETKEASGYIEIYSLQTFERIGAVKSDGIEPHEIHTIPGNPSELAVTHYGALTTKRSPVSFNVVDAKLTILDAATFKPKRHYAQPEFDAILTHMRVAKDGWAYCVQAQYIDYKKPEALDEGETAEQRALKDLEEAFDQEWDFPIPAVCSKQQKLDVSLPFLRINTQTGERELLNTGLKNHLRGQSVASNAATGLTIGVYRHSNVLVMHRAGEKPEALGCRQYGIRNVSCATEIPGTTMLVINGDMNNVAVIDLANKKEVARFETMNCNSTHLFHDIERGEQV